MKSIRGVPGSATPFSSSTSDGIVVPRATTKIDDIGETSVAPAPGSAVVSIGGGGLHAEAAPAPTQVTAPNDAKPSNV